MMQTSPEFPAGAAARGWSGERAQESCRSRYFGHLGSCLLPAAPCPNPTAKSRDGAEKGRTTRGEIKASLALVPSL